MNLSVIQYNDYKEYLRAVIHSETSRRGLQTQLAKFLNCQASYIYQVLKGKADLTEDQSYMTTVFFNFTELEREYFLQLTRYSKVLLPQVKKHIESELKKMKEKSYELLEHADAKKPGLSEEAWTYYFSDYRHSFIHLLTESEKFQTVEDLSLKLNCSHKEIMERLKNLQKYGFVKYENQKWIKLTPSVHFSSNSNYNLNLHLLRRAQAINSIVKNDSKSIHFSSLFMIDDETYEELRSVISSTISKVQRKIHSGGADNLSIFCLDLFSPLNHGID